MAISRFVLTADVTVTPDVLATVTAGEPGTGGAAGYGSLANGTPSGTQGRYGVWPTPPLTSDASWAQCGTWQAGTVIYASSVSTDGAAYALYQAIGAGNLRAFVQGQDDVGHAALSN